MHSESKDAPSTDTQQVVVEVVHPPGGFHELYANYTYLTFTRHDVRMLFAQLYRLPQVKSDVPTNRIEERAAITLAWSEAKAFAESLVATIALFESVNGEIKGPNLP
jgi:hypothetical protein